MRKLLGLVACLGCVVSAPDARADDTHQKQSYKSLIEQGYKVKAIENAALGDPKSYNLR